MTKRDGVDALRNLTYGNIITTVILLVTVGMWAGGMNAKTSFIDILSSIDRKITTLEENQIAFESQILVWLDDAEKQRAEHYTEVMGNIKKLHEYNKSLNPEYEIPELPQAKWVNKY